MGLLDRHSGKDSYCEPLPTQSYQLIVLYIILIQWRLQGWFVEFGQTTPSLCLFIVMYIMFHYGTPVQRSTSDEPPSLVKKAAQVGYMTHKADVCVCFLLTWSRISYMIPYNYSNVPYCLSAMSLTNRAISSHAVGSVFRIDSYLSTSNHKLRRSRTRAHVKFCACAVSDTAAHVWNDVAYTGRSTEYYVGLL